MIIIELPKTEIDKIQNLQKEHEDNVTVIETKKFDGQTELIHVLLILTPLLINSITKIIIELIKAKKNVKIITDGVEIKGITEKNILEILQKIQLKNKKKGKK